MGVHFDSPPPPVEVQHGRLVLLRALIQNGIPCILWGEDALAFAHNVPTTLFDQHIIVPDGCLSAAADAIWATRPFSETSIPSYALTWKDAERGKLPNPFPKSIRLGHEAAIRHDTHHAVYPEPGFVLLLPESAFGFSCRGTPERYQSLSPPLHPSNAGILIPRYHTFIEGIVELLINPPCGYYHERLWAWARIHLSYLLMYRIKQSEDRPSTEEEKAAHAREEAAIISEVREDCRWILHREFSHTRLTIDDCIDAKRRRDADAPVGQQTLPSAGQPVSPGRSRRNFSSISLPPSGGVAQNSFMRCIPGKVRNIGKIL